jgi:hypothetical protein
MTPVSLASSGLMLNSLTVGLAWSAFDPFGYARLGGRRAIHTCKAAQTLGKVLHFRITGY